MENLIIKNMKTSLDTEQHFSCCSRILLSDIPNSFGLVLGETRLPYLYLQVFCDCSALRVLVAFNIYGVHI